MGFFDASITAIASAASLLFRIPFILCDCQAMGLMLFSNASNQKTMIFGYICQSCSIPFNSRRKKGTLKKIMSHFNKRNIFDVSCKV